MTEVRPPAPAPGPAVMRRFGFAAAAAALLLAAVTAFLAAGAAGTRALETVRDLAQLVFLAAALVSCGLAARGSGGSTRRAWGWIAASAGVALVGAGAEAAYFLIGSADPPFPSTAGLAFLASAPLAIAGLLAFPAASYQFATRRRLVLDVAMVGCSLAFISGTISLPQAYLDSRSTIGGLVSVGYPVADILLITVVFASLRRSFPSVGPPLLLLACGLAVNVVANSASALQPETGVIPPDLGLPLAVGSMFAYALVALAPLWPHKPSSAEETQIAPWPDVIPYLGVCVAGLVSVFALLSHRRIDAFVAFPGAGLLLVLIGNQFLAQAEARSLLVQSRRAEAKVREREAMLNNIIEHAPQGVASIATDRRITNANPRLASMLFLPQQLLIGSSTDSFLPEEYVSRIFRSFAPGGEGTDEIYESDSRVRRADGSQFWVHWSATPIRKPDGGIDYFLATFEDVTAKREAEETAVANLAQLEKLNRLKSEFVSMVSHEFRTALVGIQGFSELIRDQEMDVREIKLLAQDIYSDSLRLNRMITEMLDFDRLEAGKLHLDLKPLDINELVEAAVGRAAASSRTHVVKTDLAPVLPAVIGDPDRLAQVLANLLSNAVKYSPPGTEVCVATTLAGGSVEVAVRDHGRGIPPEFISRLFGRYERYEDKHAGKIIGTGLGLAITRQIVEMHGGRVTVESVVGQGSEFRFTLPLAQTAAAVPRSA